MARALRVAGMSITVTSFTDIIAFLIGSSTSLPALKNFCFYAAFGIFFDYLYQITFFTACLALDEKRKSRNKADCFFCLDCPPAACCACCKPEKMKKSPLQKFLGQGLGSHAQQLFDQDCRPRHLLRHHRRGHRRRDEDRSRRRRGRFHPRRFVPEDVHFGDQRLVHDVRRRRATLRQGYPSIYLKTTRSSSRRRRRSRITSTSSTRPFDRGLTTSSRPIQTSTLAITSPCSRGRSRARRGVPERRRLRQRHRADRHSRLARARQSPKDG